MTGLSTENPRRYEIRVRGPIGQTILEAFPTVAARHVGSDTLLSGRLPDQSALYGVLHVLEIFGIELLEVSTSDANSVE